MNHKRITIYPKDIMIITGKSERSCRLLLKKIKAHFRKEDHHLVSVKELSDYLGLDHEEVISALR